MADFVEGFNVTLGDVAYFIFLRGTISMCKGFLNVLHIRRAHQCEECHRRCVNEQIERGKKKGWVYV